MTPSSARRRTKRFSASGCSARPGGPVLHGRIHEPAAREQRRDAVDRVVDLGLADDQRRQEADRRRAGGVDDEALLEQRAADERRARPPSTSKPTISPRPRTSRTPGSSREAARSRSPQLAHAREKRRVVEHVERGVRGGGHDRAAGERRAVVAGLRARRRAAAPVRARRSAGRRRAPWPSSSRRARRPSARRPTASRCGPRPHLDLVEDQRARRARRRPRGPRAAARRERTCTPVSPWTGSSSTRGGALVDRGGERLGGRRDRAKPGTSGANGACLDSCGVAAERAVRAAVEAAVQRRRSSPPGLALRASLSAASTASAPEFVKNTLPPSELVGQPLGQPRHRLGVEEVADVDEPRPPARGSPRRRAGGSARRSRRRCRRGSRGTRCRRRPTGARPRRARTRPGSARRSASAGRVVVLQLVRLMPPP